jgi:hypothetical protein
VSANRLTVRPQFEMLSEDTDRKLEGHPMTEQNLTPDEIDDTEGHGYKREDEDDTQGHGYKREDEDDDVEGHGYKH